VQPCYCGGVFFPPINDGLQHAMGATGRCSGTRKPPYVAFKKCHALSIAADRDIVICGTAYILVRIIYRHPHQVNQYCSRTRATEGTGPGNVGDPTEGEAGRAGGGC